MTHTPGPWERRVNGLGHIQIVRKRLPTEVEFEPIATLTTKSIGSNARLIAAAPDLLEALENLEPYLDGITCYASAINEHEPNKLAVQARAAIAKAKSHD